MKYVRMFGGPDGESHFEEVEVELPVAATSEPIPLSSVIFRTADAPTTLGWHNAPRRQFIVVLKGTMELEVQSETRRFGPGSVVLADDLTGRGHLVRFDDAEFLLLPTTG